MGKTAAAVQWAVPAKNICETKGERKIILRSPLPHKGEKGDKMIQIILRIDGMACRMCESHINDAIRNAFAVKKVTASYTKKECVILCENDIKEEKLQAVFDQIGYRMESMKKEPYVKKVCFYGCEIPKNLLQWKNVRGR